MVAGPRSGERGYILELLKLYYLGVSASLNATSAAGNYFLGVDFGERVIAQKEFASGTLTDAKRVTMYSFTTTKTELHHFVLSATTADGSIASAVRMTILDENNRVMATLVAQAGDSASINVLLGPGRYKVILAAATRNPGDRLPTLTFRVTGNIISDPIGPDPNDTTMVEADPYNTYDDTTDTGQWDWMMDMDDGDSTDTTDTGQWDWMMAWLADPYGP